MKRLCIKIAGESGSGLLSVGEMIIKSLHDLGFYVVADREYPSVIKGEPACFLINASTKPIYSLYSKIDIMLAIDRQSLEAYFRDLNDGGILVYGYERTSGLKDLMAGLSKRKVKIVHQDARTAAEKNGGNVLMSNMVLLGMFFKTLGLPYKIIKKEVEKKFFNKPHLLKIDLKCLEAGYKKVEISRHVELPKRKNKTVLLDGNKAIAIGAIRAGCRAYYAYPMSPSSSILTYMADFSADTGMLVKQVEDEISVVNMTLGSMFMGTRALCSTSGGGYDLMTETVSLSGMIECPLVVVVAQRPGPATGLPTWTAQADLNMAVYSSHGEFPRIVVAASDPSDCFSLIQHAFNLAEKY
ncbi:MAG: 2-oxoacid:acceptor oxidoreductase family protein, partial [Patescibacteria group bacterium]